MTGPVIRHFLLGNDLFRDSLIKKNERNISLIFFILS